MKRIAVGFESTRLPPWMKGVEVIRQFADQYKFDPGEVVEIADYLGLDESALKRRVHGYSMGMRKKLLLALALRPGLEGYLLDEPYTLLDPHTREKLDRIILERSRESIVIVASHFSTSALQNAERLVLLEGGSLVSIEERRVPSRAYLCKVNNSGMLLVLDRLNPEKIIYRKGEVLVVFDRPQQPPLPNCIPILVPSTS